MPIDTWMSAIVQVATFLERSSDEVVDPDLGVHQMDQLAHTLRALLPAERERRAGAHPERVRFVQNLLDALGLNA